jgi:GT2 family glycosyltransferase
LSIRQGLGAIVYDWPRFLRHIRGDWRLIRNRGENITQDGRGVRCNWEDGSDLHIAKVYPAAGRWLMEKALADHPVEMGESPEGVPRPEVSFVIGHRGLDRLPNLLATLRSIVRQKGAAVEAVVVEQSANREIESALPSWVRYVHTPVAAATGYSRAAAFNAGAAIARGDTLVLHDNDLLVPRDYAREAAARLREGAAFADLKRFLFYFGEEDTRRVVAGGPLDPHEAVTVTQNLHGGSIAARRHDYFEIGGFDEEFVGWGGEDLDFWERAQAHGPVYAFGYLPLVHLWHARQKGKAEPNAPAVRRYYEIRTIPPAERIKRLRARGSPRP